MLNTQIRYLFLIFWMLSGCADNSSSEATGNQTPISIDRPSNAAVILSRPIDYKNNQNISYCEVLASEKQSYSGYRDQNLYPLASLSKVITTAWALEKLGPDFTFQTEWFAAPVQNQQGVFDVYLRTNNDPVFNIDKVLYLISELHKQGISKIRTLTIDETTQVYLSVLALPHLELPNVPVTTPDTIQNLALVMNSDNWSAQTAAAREKLQSWSAQNNKFFQLPGSFSVMNVQFQKADSIQKARYPIKNQFRSAKLFKYLKNLNVYSNNYVADALFSYLGGTREFKKFQIAQLKLTEQQLQMSTGSGLALTTGTVRLDNSGSCFGFLKILSYVGQLAESHGLNLGNFLYNPGRDLDGTFESKMDFADQIVIKTGRLFENPALNLAGIISTESGPVYFTFLGHGFSESEVDSIQTARDSILRNTLNYYSTRKTYLTLQDYQILL